MICDVILTFVLVFNNGSLAPRTKWLSRDFVSTYVKMMKNNPVLKDAGVKEVVDIKIVDVPPYDCFEGPK